MSIYKHDRGDELTSTEKQLQLSGQNGTGARELLQISSAAPSVTLSPLPDLVDIISLQNEMVRSIKIHSIKSKNIYENKIYLLHKIISKIIIKPKVEAEKKSMSMYDYNYDYHDYHENGKFKSA